MVRRQVEMKSDRAGRANPTPPASIQAGVTLMAMEQVGNNTKILAGSKRPREWFGLHLAITLRKLHTAQKILEAGIGAQGVKSGISFEL